MDLCNCTIKSYLKGVTSVDISKFTEKADLVGLKSDVIKSDIGKLIVFFLSKLSSAVKMMLLKRLHMLNWLKKSMLFRKMILVI